MRIPRGLLIGVWIPFWGRVRGLAVCGSLLLGPWDLWRNARRARVGEGLLGRRADHLGTATSLTPRTLPARSKLTSKP